MQNIVASKIRRIASLTIPENDKRCYLTITDNQRIEMVYRNTKGAANGQEWFFLCSITKKYCRKLYNWGGLYVHSSAIKGFSRLNKPAWYTNTSFNKLLVLKQGQIDAEKALSKKYFKKYYAGQPTKKYLKCLNQIDAAISISMSGIINGAYDNLL